MTTFQLVALIGFVAAVAVTYFSKPLRSLLANLFAGSAVPAVQPSIAVLLVRDIVSVTELRDKLAAENCLEGVDACTNLLRVIVEHQQPSKGIV
jgi:hypothetical protein